MLLLIIKNFNVKILSINNFRLLSSSSAATTTINDENFPVLNILPYGKIQKEKKISLKSEVISPRYKRLKFNCNWNNVWPTARNFHPSTVPLPIHMSYVDDNKIRAPINKFNNPELLKIPNFLHLTPVIVKKQCDELKKRFCTKWPKSLKNDDDCEEYFPITIRTMDFIFSGPNIRWPKSRIVELSIKLSKLKLDEHSLDKIKRLLSTKNRYNKETDLITIRTDSCPLRKQNYDYAHYLLTALYFESWKIEKWESEKEYSDWEKYYWQKSKSKENLLEYMKKIYPDKNFNEIEQQRSIKEYETAVCKLNDYYYQNDHQNDNIGDEKTKKLLLNEYKKSVVQLLFN